MIAKIACSAILTSLHVPDLQMYQTKLRHWQKRKAAPFLETGSRAYQIICIGVLLAAVEMAN